MKKCILRKAAFVLIVILSLCLLQRLLVPKYAFTTPEGAFIEEYYREENKSFDLIFLGDCEVYHSFSPALLWREYGISSYIRGSADQYVWQSYYLLEDTLRYYKPECVVFNVLAMKNGEARREEYNRMSLEGMEWSLTKLKAIYASMGEEENTADYIFPILRYHSRWSSLSRIDFQHMFDTRPVTCNGYYMKTAVKPLQNIPEERPLNDYRFPEKCWKYLDKLRELCDNEGIELILVKAPGLYPFWYEEYEAQVEEYAFKYGLRYINFSKIGRETGIDLKSDSFDGGLHLNVSGAEKLSLYLGEILTENAVLPDRRDDKELCAIWEEKLKLYDRWRSMDDSERLK